MTTPPIKISDEAHAAASRAAEDAYRRWRDTPNRDAYVSGFIALAAKTAAEAVAPLIAAQVLQAHASDLDHRTAVEPEMPSTNRSRQRAAQWARAAAKRFEDGAMPENGRERSPATGGVIDSSHVFVNPERARTCSCWALGGCEDSPEPGRSLTEDAP